MNAILPNFLIIGGAKGGTTSLYHYLSQHPDVFMSKNKEPCFLCVENGKRDFSNEKTKFITDISDYLRLFDRAKGFRAIGEASTAYLYKYDETIQNIKKYFPDYKKLKIVVILRNPIDRAFSHYLMNCRDLREELTFDNALAAEKKRLNNDWHFDFAYVDRGMYFEQMKAYMDVFDNIKIFLYEDLEKDADGLMIQLFSFLGVPDNFIPETGEHFNVSGIPKNKALLWLVSQQNPFVRVGHRFLPNNLKHTIKKVVYAGALEKSKMDFNVRKKLIEIFRTDVTKLEKLIGRDLSDWLS